jgi:hypothetical protein
MVAAIKLPVSDESVSLNEANGHGKNPGLFFCAVRSAGPAIAERFRRERSGENKLASLCH